MKPWKDLTHRGRMRRMRRLAQQALAAYGLDEARFKFLREAGNVLFRVYTSELPAAETEDLFAPGQYLLRVHEPGYQEPEAIELELAWLAAMRREAGLPVPEPIPTRDGRLLLPVTVPGIPQTRNCSLLRWLKGRSVMHNVQPKHFRAQGQLMARMHNFSAQWQPPAGLPKRQFDWAGLFQNDVGSGVSNAEAWALLPAEWHDAFAVVAERVRRVMDTWGQDPDVYGLIHGDLGVDANLLFWHGEARPIDFDDSGYGYWVFDLAVGLEHCWQDAAFPRYREALLTGYAEQRSLSEEQLAQLELFIAAVEVYWDLWAIGGTHRYPHMLPEYEERIRRNAELVVRYVQREDSARVAGLSQSPPRRGADMRAEDLPSTAEWEIWHQDTFDRECPRQVEVAGRGLLAGLVELWARHLLETLQADGRKGFSRFNLWWKQEGKSVEIVGDWEGQVRLRQWIYGDKPQANRKARDQALLQRIAAAHQRCIQRGETSAEILALAKAAGSREDFEQQVAFA